MSMCALRRAAEKSPVEILRARLYYQSKKRGILENDILVGGFAEKRLGSLNEAELHQYGEIINGEHMEWDLYYYMTGILFFHSIGVTNVCFCRQTRAAGGVGKQSSFCSDGRLYSKLENTRTRINRYHWGTLHRRQAFYVVTSMSRSIDNSLMCAMESALICTFVGLYLAVRPERLFYSSCSRGMLYAIKCGRLLVNLREYLCVQYKSCRYHEFSQHQLKQKPIVL